jgi:hypothetical protein
LTGKSVSQRVIDENRQAHCLSDTWRVASIRAEDDRIIICCEEGADPFWFSEKPNPPLKPMFDKIYQATVKVPPGAWGTSPAPQPEVTRMATRSQSTLKPGKFVVCHLVLLTCSSGELYDLGEIDQDNDEVIATAIHRGGIPDSWDVCAIDKNPKRIIVGCDPDQIDTMRSFNLNRTWS